MVMVRRFYAVVAAAAVCRLLVDARLGEPAPEPAGASANQSVASRGVEAVQRRTTKAAYQPADAALAERSEAPTLTFYAYRAVGEGADYPLANVNAASASGVLWYLHNEVIGDCSYNGTVGQRRWGATRIRRFKVSTKATRTLYARGMNFGKFCTFSFGECTGPFREGHAGAGNGANMKPEWDEFGFYVGCTSVGDYPFGSFRSGRRYPNATWYSFPGACPSMRYDTRTEKCIEEMPGGLCDSVTGQGNCTYHVEAAGEVNIDELVGIRPAWKNRADFCKAGCNEGESQNEPQQSFGPQDDYEERQKTQCTSWWANIWDPLANANRVKDLLSMFRRKYPESSTEEDLPQPTCDFNLDRYSASAP